MIQKILFISIFLGLWSCNKINDTVSTDNDNLSVRLTMSKIFATEVQHADINTLILGDPNNGLEGNMFDLLYGIAKYRLRLFIKPI